MLGGLLLSGSALAGAASGAALAHVQSHHEDHMLGASLDMLAVGPAADWRLGLAAARAEMLRLDAVMSGWRADSELAALNAADRFEASADLFALIVEAERLRLFTGGAFSPRLGGAIRLRRAGDADVWDVMRAALEAESGEVRFDPRTRAIEKSPAIQFDVDGIAKGYVLDKALRAALRAAPGLRGLLIDVGGDIASWGEGPDNGAWRVGVARAGAADNMRPQAVALLRNQAIATSGRGMRDIGKQHHILDPRTGAPAAAAMQATVIAPNAMTADALATAFSVVQAAESIDLADALPGIAVSLTESDGVSVRNGRWRTFAGAAPKTCEAPPLAAQGAWPKGFALDVDIDIVKPKEADFKRQYVSVWISDEQKRLVKTLLILGDKPRWRESNYIWWRRFERLNLEAVQAVSKPTRMPGKYKVRWDGNDDAGAFVPQGKYILNIEASREHGGHGFQSIPLEIGGKAFEASADATLELNAAHAKFGASK